ncbi:hypothetical protein Tco_0178574 [Tanacetum coccineum]
MSEFEISSWRGARVDVRTYLLGGAIDSSEANGIIRDPKLELENSRFTFNLVPLSYESVDVVVGENWLLRHKVEMLKEFDLLKWDPTRGILLLGQQVVSELVDLRNFARRYGFTICTYDGCIQENVNTASKTTVVKGVEKVIPPTTVEEKA